MTIEPKNERPAGYRRGQGVQHQTIKAATFLKKSAMTVARSKADNLGAELGGHVPEVILTLALKTERGTKLTRELRAPQAASGQVDAAAARKAISLPEVTRKVQRELKAWGQPRPDLRPLGVVAVDTLTVLRGVLCERGDTALVDERFSVIVLPLQALVSSVRKLVGEESAELAEAASAFQDAATAGLVPALFYAGSTLVVFGGRWPLPLAGGS
jgi:hypothetical protein